MAMSKRDQRTLSITVGLLLTFVVWSFGIEPVWQSYKDLDEKLEKERSSYVENQQTLAEAKSIDEGYTRVEAQFPKDDPERDPSEVFNEEVVDLVEKTIGKIPEFSPPNTAEIKGATGYEFLILPLSFKSKLPKVSDLLQEFDKKGFLIQTATITRDNDLDKDELTVELNLGRIVKIADETQEAGPARPGSLKLGRGGSNR
jgi:hypothetical protein